MIHNFLPLLKHDIFEGIFHRWRYFLVAVLFFAFTDFVFVNNVSTFFASSDENLKCSIADIILNMFIGNEQFAPDLKKGIHISIIWLVFHTLMFSFIGFYIEDDLKKNATSLIIRVKSRKQWWTSKAIWCVLTVSIYYALFFAVALVFAALFGTISFEANTQIAYEFLNINVSDVGMFDVIFASFILPMIISTSVALFSAMLSLIMKPVYAFLIVIFYLAASAFYCSVFLLFNFSMIIRNNFYSVNGVANQYGALIAICLMMVSYSIGLILIRRKDIL